MHRYVPLILFASLFCTREAAISTKNVVFAATLSITFYQHTCPDLEEIVLSATNDTMQYDPVNMPAILRLHFHDCMVRGCDASVLLESRNGEKTEKYAPENHSLFGFGAIEYIKGVVDDECGSGIVSCADVLALAARAAVILVGGPTWELPLGRRDGLVSLASEVPNNLPTANMNVSQVMNRFFIPKGLDVKDLSALVGAHTIGFAHCSSFINRIYGHNTTFGIDPLMDEDLGLQLQTVCPEPPARSDPNSVAPLDPNTFDMFDFGFYRNVLRNQAVILSDQFLATNPTSRQYVKNFAINNNQFFSAWKDAIVKMGQIGVLTGTQGEIRMNCSWVNS